MTWNFRNKHLNVAAGILLAFIIYTYVFLKLRNLDFSHFQQNLVFQPVLGLSFVSCWIIQIILETYKWQLLVSDNQKINFKQSLASILSGYALSVFTPGRSGDWLGRALSIRTKRGGTIFLAAASGMLQTVIIVIVAIPAMIITYHFFNPLHLKKLSESTYPAIALSVMVCGIIMLFIRFLPKKIQIKLLRALSVFRKIQKGTITKVSSLTFIRYMVFSCQFILLLTMLSKIPASGFIWYIPVYYLAITIIPVVGILEPGIRLSSAFLILEQTGLTTEILTIAVLIIWIFNFIIPALAGSVFVYKFKLFNRE